MTDDIDPALERAILTQDTSGIPDSRKGSVDAWRQQIQILKLQDWDKRVRIGAGNRGGARIGSVRSVPPLGVKLALRKAMIERANAEIYAILAAEDLRRLRLRKGVAAGLWIGVGAAAAGGMAAAGRIYFGW